MRFTTTGIAVSASALVLPLAVALAPGTPATAAASTDQQTCRGMNKLIKAAPKTTKSLPGGAKLQVWDNKKKVKKKDLRKIEKKYKKKATRKKKKAKLRLKAKRHLRIVAATIPKSTLKGHTYATAGVTGITTTSSHVSSARDAIVVTNGSVFSVSATGPSRGPQVVAGEVRKASRAYEGAVVTLASGRTDFARIATRGYLRIDGIKYDVMGINDGSVPSEGITIYTEHWGAAKRPTGVVDVVVDSATGLVLSVLSGRDRGVRPAPGTYVVTAKDEAGEALALLLPGVPVESAYRIAAKATDGSGVDLALTDPVRSAVGYSAILMQNSVIRDGQCTARNEQRRPRTVYGKKANGDLIVMTVSGVYGPKASAVGGASMKQALRYIRHLGAVDAVILDGGGSTTMLIRRWTTGPLVRYDRGKNVGSQRRVGNAFAFSLGAP